jgi:coenzyme PQQ synthesis protein D (PqqD)
VRMSANTAPWSTAVENGEFPYSPVPADDASEGITASYAPRRRGGVLEIDLGDGLIIYDRDANLVHHLNPSAATVWRMCEGRRTVGELVQAIVEGVGASPHEVNAQVTDLLRELHELGLTEDASGSEL